MPPSHTGDELIHVDAPLSPPPAAPLGTRLRSWLGADIDPERCRVRLSEAELDELTRLRIELRRHPRTLAELTAEDFDLPRLRAVMAGVKRRLDTGVGVAIVDALPLDDMGPDEARAVFWTLGTLVGRTVAQKWDGTLLYEVADHGLPYGYGVRGSYTNVELVFHTDNAFGLAPPSYVGLLCLQPALTGGVSRFCSLVAVHDRLLQARPDLLARLYRPVLWDRQAEHAPGGPKVAAAPMFRLLGERLLARANASLVRKGYAVAGEPLDAELEEALALFEQTAHDPRMWFEAPLERGQLQYLDNVDVAHYRSAFRDHPDPACKRRLVRTWHRDHGLRDYDG